MGKLNIVVVLDSVRSTFNVGQAFRISDAAGIAKLYLCGITPYPDTGIQDKRRLGVKEKATKELKKTALSAYEAVDWSYRSSSIELLQELKSQGFQIISVELTNKSLNYTKAKYKFPLALVLGNEREGVTPENLDLSDQIIEIPMHGKGTSLNVTNSLAIVVYEILRQFPN